MWTEAHRARHEARLKDMVRVSAVGEIARWLERADPPRSPRRTPLRWIVAALAWDLRVGGPGRGVARGVSPGGHPVALDCGGPGLALAGGWPVAGAARRLSTVAHRLWLVPALAGGWLD